MLKGQMYVGGIKAARGRGGLNFHRYAIFCKKKIGLRPCTLISFKICEFMEIGVRRRRSIFSKKKRLVLSHKCGIVHVSRSF